jgi:hypothetical protein
MEPRPRVAAGWAAGLGFLLAIGLVIRSTFLGPFGSGDGYEWLLTWLALLGFPTSLPVSLLGNTASPWLVPTAYALALPANWGLLAYLASRLASAFKSRGAA